MRSVQQLLIAGLRPLRTKQHDECHGREILQQLSKRIQVNAPWRELFGGVELLAGSDEEHMLT